MTEEEFDSARHEGGLQYDLPKDDYKVVELSVVIWEGYVLEDLAEARKFTYRYHDTGTHILDVSFREITDDEFKAFQACAPEFFESTE